MGGCFGKSATQIEQEEREEKQRKMLAKDVGPSAGPSAD